MSRLTAAQVIGVGEYLNPDFDPASLTIPQLLGVLGFHNINFPTPYSKSKLVQLFNDEIKPKASKFKRDRIKREQSLASDDGITDGVTGRPIGREKITLKRRSSRRLSRDPTKEPDPSPVRPDPPKRRRSSAQPNLGGPPRRSTVAPPTLIEESEPEEDELSLRKVGRSKKSSEAAGSQARRVSRGTGEESGWEENNIFQSGAESSSPLRPTPSKSKVVRKSLGPRKSRKSMSAPPQMSSSPPRPSYIVEDLGHSPPQSNFEPELPPIVSRETRNVISKAPKSVRRSVGARLHLKEDESGDDELNVIDVDPSDADRVTDVFRRLEEQVYDEEQSVNFDDEDDDQVAAVSRRISEGGKPLALSAPEPKRTPFVLRLIYALIGVAVSVVIFNFKNESAAIGYCDTGSNTNDALEALKSRWNAIEECNRENRTLLYPPSLLKGTGRLNEECPPPLLIPLLYPATCTPCPEHASCTQHSVSCNTGYLLRSHPLLFFLPTPLSSLSNVSLVPLKISTLSELSSKVIAEVTDGIPGLGPVAFPPRCLEDPMRKRNIGAMGRAMEKMLAQEKGRRLCLGLTKGKAIPAADGGEAKKWGIDVGTLREVLKNKVPPRLLSSFDDTFNEAVQQLIQWGGVIMGEDSKGKRYLAHETADMSWNCVITVKSRDVWVSWRSTILGIGMGILGLFAIRARRATKLVEGKRVAELVQIALDTLRNQELAHHTDPVTTPQPYLSSLQLRDLILQEEHSVPTRRRVWEKVEQVVEGNANVRVNLEEVDGGDEMRVWRWVGSAGRGRRIPKS